MRSSAETLFRDRFRFVYVGECFHCFLLLHEFAEKRLAFFAFHQCTIISHR